MKIAFFETRSYEKMAFNTENKGFNFEISYLEPRLNPETAMLAAGCECVCAFVNADLSKSTLKVLSSLGVKILALRCAGFNHVDLNAAQSLGIKVVRVPEYSPFAIAEHVIALIQTLNRKTHKAYNRVRESNFSLDGLMGFDLYGKTVSVVGTGKIGKTLARILHGFGCKILLNDINPDHEFAQSIGAKFVSLNEVYTQSDIISLHVPLTPSTRYSINNESIKTMKKGVMIINTGRGALINTKDLIEALKTGQVGAAGLDVYEEEESYFFQDHSDKIISDDQLARLMTFPNVLVTGHQGFLTNEAMSSIARISLQNIKDFKDSKPLLNEVTV